MVESDSKKRLLALHAAKEVRGGKVFFHLSIHSSPGSHPLFPRSTRRRCRFAVGSSVREFSECRGDNKKCCCCLSWKASDYRSIEVLARTSCNDPHAASNAYITDIVFVRLASATQTQTLGPLLSLLSAIRLPTFRDHTTNFSLLSSSTSYHLWWMRIL